MWDACKSNTMGASEQRSLTLHPIGFIRSQKQVKFQALHQPVETQSERNVLELLPDNRHQVALQDLAGFSRVWLLWWFHRNSSWRPLVLPPRGPARRRGVFATRSPHRPNPLGLTPVQLIAVERRRLILGPCDLVDGTPIFDIKPYIPAFDSFPDERAGWLDDVAAGLETAPEFVVQFSPAALIQAEWLLTHWQIDFRSRLIELLARDPTPHRSRRIRRRGDSLFVIGCGAWRAFFCVLGKTVDVQSLDAAYPLRFLNNLALEELPDREAQVAFVDRFAGSAS